MNGKTIKGDDTKNLNTLVDEYNALNPTEMIQVVSGGSEVLDISVTLTLAGGEDGYAKAHGTIVKQLQRVQSANYGFTVNRQDINQFGHASRLDSIVVSHPQLTWILVTTKIQVNCG